MADERTYEGLEQARPLRWTRIAWWLSVALVSLWCGQYSDFSSGSTRAVVVVGGVTVVVGLAWRGRRRPAPKRLAPAGVLGWVVVLLSFSAIELVNDHLGSTYDHPTLSVLMAGPLTGQVLRTLAWAAWLAFGAALVVG